MFNFLCFLIFAGGGLFQKEVSMFFPVVDGIVRKVDLEKRFIYVLLDKEGKMVQEIQIDTIESVYLIRGKVEKLKEYLLGGAIGSAAGASSVFWNRIVGSSGSGKNENGVKQQISLADLSLRVVGGTGAGLIVSYLLKRGEKEEAPFPVYDPSIEKKSSESGIDFSNKNNLKTMLTEGESFVHITLRI